jgi:predicted PurR-regulated permease PerM
MIPTAEAPDPLPVETAQTDEPPDAAAAPRAVDEHALLPMPIDVRSAALGLIAALASIYALHWARDVFIPLALGLLVSYSLAPLVDRLQRWRVPRAIGAALLLVGAIGGFGSLVYSLSDDAAVLISSLPDAAQKVRDSLRAGRGAPESPIEKVQRAAAKLEEAAAERSPPATPAQRGVTRVQVERAHFDIQDYLWTGTLGLVGIVGQALVVCFIAYFLLASGDSFRRKMVRIAGPGFAEKRITIEVLDDITRQIQSYLRVQIFGSVLVGLATGLAFLFIGLDHAAVWGVAAAVLNLVPYLGSVAISGSAALVGFLQFGTAGEALLVGGSSLAIHTVVGNLVSPWLTGRASRMSPVVIFVGVLAWGWLWGLWGLLLGAPLLMVVKAVCDRVDHLKGVSELLGT